MLQIVGYYNKLESILSQSNIFRKGEIKMNETLKTILTRRSIRKYKEEQIKEEELQAILEAGKFAPCGLGQQSSYFTVIQNKEMLQKINKICKNAYIKSGNKNFEALAKAEKFSAYHNAPTFIIVSGDQKSSAAYLNNGSVALENMLLAAESLGIGSCWIHSLIIVFPTQEGQDLKKELGIPDDYTFVGAATFGYKDMAQPSPSPRKEGIVNIIT